MKNNMIKGPGKRELICIFVMSLFLVFSMVNIVMAEDSSPITFTHPGGYEYTLAELQEAGINTTNPPQPTDGDYLTIDGTKCYYNTGYSGIPFETTEYEDYQIVWDPVPSTFEEGKTYTFKYSIMHWDETWYDSAPIEVKIKNAATTYTVKFDTDGGTPVPDDQPVTEGQKAAAPAEPKKEGHTFIGWFVQNLETQWDFDDPVTGNMTLYAKYSVNQYTLNFDTNGGKETIPSITQDYNTPITKPNDPTRDKFVFKEWSPAIPDVMPANDLTVVAQWTKMPELVYQAVEEETLHRSVAKLIPDSKSIFFHLIKVDDKLTLTRGDNSFTFTFDGNTYYDQTTQTELDDLIPDWSTAWDPDQDFDNAQYVYYHYYGTTTDNIPVVSNSIPVLLFGDPFKTLTEITFEPVFPYKRQEGEASEATNPPEPVSGDKLTAAFSDGSEEVFTFSTNGTQGADFYNSNGVTISQYDNWDLAWLPNQSYTAGSKPCFVYQMGDIQSNPVEVEIVSRSYWIDFYYNNMEIIEEDDDYYGRVKYYEGDKVGDHAQNITWEGHVRVGFNTSRDGHGTAYADDTQVTENLTLYAQWIPSKPVPEEGKDFIAPVGKTGLVYDGTQQELLKELGRGIDGKILDFRYGADPEESVKKSVPAEFAKTNPARTNAGTYEVYYFIEENEYFRSLGSAAAPANINAPIIVMIGKKPITSDMLTITPSEFFFDGQMKTVDINVSDNAGITEADWELVDSESILSARDAGIYKVCIRAKEDSINYTSDALVCKAWRINQAPERHDHFFTNFYRLNYTLPNTGFSSVHPTVLPEQPMSLKYEPLKMHLQIPSLNVDAEMVTIPQTDNSWSVEWLADSVGLLSGSNIPGNGISVIAAHNTLDNTSYGPFARLSEMVEDDLIFVEKSNGSLLRFRVYANELILPDDFESLKQTAEREMDSLVLVTCENESVDGGYLNRRVVFAKPIG